MSEDEEHLEGGRERRRQRIPKVFFKPKPVKVGDELEVTISEVSRRGDGLIRIQGYVVFIPNTKQGDKVKIRITEIRPNYAVAQVI
jgi:predicted RNA-binding protein with TRAM domain